MPELEGGREVELGRLRLDRRDDLVAIVAGIAAPQRGRAVEDRPAFGRVVVPALGPPDEARAPLEGAVRREGQPPGGGVVRDLRVVGGAEIGGARHWAGSGSGGRPRTFSSAGRRDQKDTAICV